MMTTRLPRLNVLLPSIPLHDLRPTMMCDLKDQGASVLAAEDVVSSSRHQADTR